MRHDCIKEGICANLWPVSAFAYAAAKESFRIPVYAQETKAQSFKFL